MAGRLKNVFWIGANILFDLRSGGTSETLLLVYRIEDASTFSETDVSKYLDWVSARVPKIRWEIQKSPEVRGGFVIRGEQDVRL